MNDFSEKLGQFKNICKNAGIKITPQRIMIYRILSTTDSHPSADYVYKEARKSMPNISYDTINRTLNTFARIGAAFVVEGSGEVKRFDAGLGSHQHFKCVLCKRIIDFHCVDFDNVPRPAELNENFEILRGTVYFEGICDKCKVSPQDNLDN